MFIVLDNYYFTNFILTNDKIMRDPFKTHKMFIIENIENQLQVAINSVEHDSLTNLLNFDISPFLNSNSKCPIYKNQTKKHTNKVSFFQCNDPTKNQNEFLGISRIENITTSKKSTILLGWDIVTRLQQKEVYHYLIKTIFQNSIFCNRNHYNCFYFIYIFFI